MPYADEFIVGCWHEIGLCGSGGYGMTPLTYQEVKAYSDLVIELTPFEASALIKMSKAYISEQSLATKELHRDTCLINESKELYEQTKAYRNAEVSRKMRMLAQQGK